MTDYVNLWIAFNAFVGCFVILLWDLMRKKAGKSMTQRRYSATTMTLTALTLVSAMIAPLGVIAVIHPGLVTALVEYLTTENLLYFGLLLLYVLAVTTAAWGYTRVYPVNDIPEKQPS